MPKVLRREPEEELRWDERTVELITCQGREQETALTLGTLAVHGAHKVYERGPSGRGKLTLMDRGGWSVTHLPSGLVVVYGFFAIGAALEAGELLWRSCRAAMQAKRRDEVLALLPLWARPWSFACREAGKFIKPE